jgi:hypothetical protein
MGWKVSLPGCSPAPLWFEVICVQSWQNVKLAEREFFWPLEFAFGISLIIQSLNNLH